MEPAFGRSQRRVRKRSKPTPRASRLDKMFASCGHVPVQLRLLRRGNVETLQFEQVSTLGSTRQDSRASGSTRCDPAAGYPAMLFAQGPAGIAYEQDLHVEAK